MDMGLQSDNLCNKKRSTSYYFVFIIIAVLICLFPIYGSLIDHDYKLSGVASTGEALPVDLESMWTGKTQSSLEEKVKGKVPGRTGLVRLHSQVLYSLFNTSSNSNVVIGSRHSLYEPEYLCEFLNLWSLMSEDAQDELIEKLVHLQSLLDQKGKQLYIFITPSKVRYDYSNIPWFYRALTSPKYRTNYDSFIRKLRNTSINYFDSIEYINENMPDSTIFYSSGIHWGNAAAAQVTAAMLEDMKADTGYELGSLEVSLTDSENGIAPDQDLLSILNLFFYINEDTYKVPEFSYTPGKDHPDVLMRGGSFMGQTLSKLIDQGTFDKSIYFQNNLVIYNRADVQTLSDFNAYDEIDTADMVDNSELVILEVNEEKIWIMGWGFIDELITVLQEGQIDNDETTVQLIGQKDKSTDENPWGLSIGHIEYKGNDSIILTTPIETMIQINARDNINSLSFDAEIHELVRQYSDGCTLLVETEGDERTEYQVPGGMDEQAVIHVEVHMNGARQVSISYVNPDGTTSDCDWLVISNIEIGE